MAHTGFIVASYAIAVGGVLGMMAISWFGMRRAEAQAEALRRGRRGE